MGASGSTASAAAADALATSPTPDCGVCGVAVSDAPPNAAPRFLPCFHTAHAACCDRAAATPPLKCCHCERSFPDVTSAGMLKTNVVLTARLTAAAAAAAVSSAAAKTSAPAAAAGPQSMRCAKCEADVDDDGAAATVECTTCAPAVRLCAEHAGLHRRAAPTKTHVLKPLAPRPGPVPAPAPTTAPSTSTAPPPSSTAPSPSSSSPLQFDVCTKHQRPMEVHCKTCDVMACAQCALEVHPQPQHTVAVFTAATHEDLLKRLKAAVERASTRGQELRVLAEDWDVATGAVDRQAQAVSKIVTDDFNRILAAIEQRKQAALTEIEHQRTERKKVLDDGAAAVKHQLVAVAAAAAASTPLLEPSAPVSWIAQLAPAVSARLEELSAGKAPPKSQVATFSYRPLPSNFLAPLDAFGGFEWRASTFSHKDHGRARAWDKGDWGRTEEGGWGAWKRARECVEEGDAVRGRGRADAWTRAMRMRGRG